MNNRSLLRIAVAALLFLPIELSAQAFNKGKETGRAEVNLRDLAKYYETHPLPEKRKMPNEEDDEERPFQPAADPGLIHLIHRDGTGHSAMMPPSPSPTDSFLSTISPGSAIPPDTHGAVDSQYCVTAINTAVHIQTRTGGNVINMSLDGFWAPLMGSSVDAFDPRVHYDPYNKRWIMVTDANGETATSTIMIAVSATSDPTGTWHMYSVRIDATGAAWLDFPNVGFNSKWVAVTGNMFPITSGGASGAVTYVFDYAAMLSGSGAPFTKFSMPTSFSICPALTYDPSQPNIYALETWRGGMGQLKLWKIAGSVSSPTMTSIAFPATTQHWRGGIGGGDAGPQLGTTNKINIGDDRITNVIYRNQKLWCAHSAFLPASSANHCATMWWQIDTLGNPIQNGLINDPSAVNFFAYPSIAVNKNDDALIGLAYLSSAIHPSAGYAMRLHTDPLDSIRTPVIYRHGQATYYVTFGGGRNRWGDYSGTCVDPRNDEDFWTIQETSTTSSTPNWDTWWSKVQLCPKPAEPSFASSPAIMCAGATGTYVLNPIAGATSYVWSLAGSAGWSSTSSADSLFVTGAVGTATVSVYATNACGQGESHIFTISTTPPPTSPTITTVVHACAGSPTAVFSATASGASSYSWTALGTGWSGSSGSTSLTATVGTGTGMIICTALNGCGSSTPDTLLVTPAVIPSTSFSVASHEVLVGATDVITVTGSVPAGSTYSWDFGGGIATPGTGAGPHTVHWTVPGTKTVRLNIDNNGCDSAYSDTVHVFIEVAVHDINGTKANFSIQPNPNTGSFDILLADAANKAVTVKIADMQGRIVYNRDFANTANKLSIKANDLPDGIYAVTLYIDGVPGTKKITITK